MNRFVAPMVVLLIIISTLTCGPKVMVPPRIDLSKYEVLGIMEFTSNKQGKLANLATRRFMDMAREDQGIIRIVNLGTQKEALREVGQNTLNQDAYKEIGVKKNVSTIIVGQFTVSDVRPDITLGLGIMNFAADVDASLSVQMVEAETGATLWSVSSSATERVGEVSIFGIKDFAFDADDPDKAYGKLVDALVYDVTRDFRVSWVRE